MVLWHEAAHWRGQPKRAGAERRVYGDSAYASQKVMIEGRARTPKTSPTMHPAQQHRGRSDQGQKPQQVTYPIARGACVRRAQATVGLWQGALQRRDQERYARVRRPSAGQHLPQSATADGTGAPMRAASGREGPRNRPDRPTNELIGGDPFRPNRAVNCAHRSFDRTCSATS